MAKVAHANPKGMYSWWWDSHISPKNSKWLQENLTDMDSKVQQMIKLIEEDADSFARRAEMYYKKRPELMKLVEEFYRAYRALAERYDHATGVIRHAHRTMSEAFPNQVHLLFADDPSTGASAEADLRTPPPAHVFSPSNLAKDAVKRNGAFTEEFDSTKNARKGLNFHDAVEKNGSGQKGENHGKDHMPSEQVSKTEKEILTLKKAIAELESEREAGLVQYQQSLERLSKLESKVSKAQEDCRRLNERASVAETEVQTLKEALAKLEAEKEATHLQYQLCLDKISNLEKSISLAQKDAENVDERAKKANSEVEALKQELVRVEAEKQAALVQHKQCLEKISVLEEQLKHAEESARMVNERADKAETEVQSLKQAIERLIEEKQASAHQYQRCLETISSLELKLSCAEEEAKRLNSEIEDGIAKLKGAEEKCHLLEQSNQTLHSELESMVVKMGAQSQELTEKQKELGRLWTCIQEERLRFVEAETAFQTLQHLHSQSQEELRSLAAELQTRAQVLREMESHSKCLQEEIQKVKEENRDLNELKLSSAVTIKDLQDEISRLRETIGKLESEVGLRVDQRNALQQEIYCLKEEINDLNKKNQSILEQVESVGLNPNCFGLLVKELQDENTMMKEKCERDRTEKLALLEKLEVLEKLREKNALLENSISDLNVELEEVRAKMRKLEDSCQSLMAEKSLLVSEKATLLSQLHMTSNNVEKLSEKNQFLENSLFDVSAELDGLRVKSKSLEESCLSLDNERAGLITEKKELVSQLNFAQQTLKDLEDQYTKLNEKCLAQEEEREITLQRLQELQNSLDTEKEEHARVSRLSQSQLADLQLQIHVVEEEVQRRNEDYEEELSNSISAQFQIFILENCVQDLKEKILSLLIEGKTLFEASKISEELISILRNENVGQQQEMKSLYDQIKLLRMGMYQLLVALSYDVKHDYEDKARQDQNLFSCIITEVKDMQNSHSKTLEENQQFVIENIVLSTLLDQIGAAIVNTIAERNTLNREFMVQSQHLSELQEERQKTKRMNEELILRMVGEDQKKEALVTEVKNLSVQLSDLKGVCQQSQEENSLLTEEKRSLAFRVSDLEQEKNSVEEENCAIFGDKISLINLSLIFKDVISEKLEEVKEFSSKIENLLYINSDLVEKLRLLEGQLENSQTENSHLRELVAEQENELNSSKSVIVQLTCEMENGKNKIYQKENELLQAEEIIRVMQSEKKELHRSFEELKRGYDEANTICEDQEKQIVMLTEVHDHQIEESRCLHEAKTNLEAELENLFKEIEEVKMREEKLHCALLKEKDEVQMWESHAEIVFGDLQAYIVRETMLQEKIRDLAEACQNREDYHDVKAVQIDLLKKRISTLEDENGGIKAQLSACIPAVVSLKDCVASLEKRIVHRRDHETDREEIKGSDVASHHCTDDCQQKSEDQNTQVLYGPSGLQDLESRIKAIEKAVLEMEKLSLQEISDANNKLEALEAMMRETEDKQIGTRKKEEPECGHADDVRLHRPQPGNSEIGNEVLTKDIMLDENSDCSSYGKSRREYMENVAQLIEFWDTSEPDCSIDMRVGKVKNSTPRSRFHEDEAGKKHESQCSSSELVIEKDLSVDRSESKRYTEPNAEGNRRTILERLDSDAQKLTNLQITVQDLKRKVDITEKSRNGKGFDYDEVQRQLEEAEDGIKKLVDVNQKLVKNVESSPMSTEIKPAVELDRDRSTRKRRLSDHARRASEKIGRLQLEVQKIQFLLLKLDEKEQNRPKISLGGSSRRVLLRDYLYGGSKTGQKKGKRPFCSCVEPPTKGD